MDKNLPEPNQRILDIIQEKAGGNVLKFASIISEGRDNPVSQQKLNRLFNVDTRTGKFPSVSHDIFEAILMKFPDVDAKWLVTGLTNFELAEDDPAYKKNTGTLEMPADLLTLVKQQIKDLQTSLQTLDENLILPGDPGITDPRAEGVSPVRAGRKAKPE